MAKLNVAELDFQAIKDQFKTFLRDQTQFKDYDFEGSNMSVLLDVLAYNTYQNNFYTNMAINEMFIDSAVLRNSVISHAKELNYLPRSMKSAKATVKVRVVDDTIQDATIAIPQYTAFSASYQGNSYEFITDKAHIARNISPGVYESDEIEIFEGSILTSFEREGFFVDDEGILKVNLTNTNADVDSIEVFVDAEATEDQNVFVRANDIFGVGPTDKVFYVEPYYDGRYTVYFGRNVFGLQPTELEDVRVKYRVTNGLEGNGIKNFTLQLTEDGVTTVTTVSQAQGGADRETLESIRFAAPKSIQIQERAVTASDYANLLKNRFPEIVSVAAYGGEELEPPQYGKVAISVYLGQGNDLLSKTAAAGYIDYLFDRTPLSVEPIFIDAEYFYAKMTVNVYYATSLTTKSVAQLETLVRNTIKNYSNDKLDDFNKTLRESNLNTLIDSADVAIQSNTIDSLPLIDFSPEINTELNPTFNFGAALVKPYAYNQTNKFSDYKPAIKSGQYDLDGVCVFFQDDGRGKIQIVSADTANQEVINNNIGTVNYDTGEVKLKGFKTESYNGAAIKITANTKTDDIIAPKGKIFAIRDSDVTVNIIETKIK
jgi:hypothetical protein